jgi:hypothetical protein
MDFTLGAIFTDRITSDGKARPVQWLRHVLNVSDLNTPAIWLENFPQSAMDDPKVTPLALLYTQTSYLFRYRTALEIPLL